MSLSLLFIPQIFFNTLLASKFIAKLIIYVSNRLSSGLFKYSRRYKEYYISNHSSRSYQHDIHGFIFPQKKADGKYLPDEVQLEAINDIISFIDKYMN